MLLNIEKKQLAPDVVVLELTGKFTLGRESQRVQWQVEELLRENVRKVILDLSGLELIDSMGIGVIMFTAGQLKKAGGELRVAGAKGLVQDVLNLAKVDVVVGFYPTVMAAAEAFSQPSQLGHHA